MNGKQAKALSPSNQKLLDRYEASLPDTSRRPFAAVARGFLYWLEDKPLTGEQVHLWLAKLRRDSFADATIRLNWSIVRRLFITNNIEWPFRRGDAPIVREIEEYAPPLHPNSIEAMVNVVLGRRPPAEGVRLDERHRAFLCLSTIWGLRRVEMVEMEPSFLDREAKLLFVQTAKRGRQRWHMVPEHILPHLEAWGFRELMSKSGMSLLFTDLKRAIGFTGEEALDVGWHSVRRSLVTLLFDGGLSAPQIEQFLRWKRSTTNMASRYHSHAWVGHEGTTQTLAADDRSGDEAVLRVHPFLGLWLKFQS